MFIQVQNMHFAELNDAVRKSACPDITLNEVVGQRYIGCGSSGRNITVHGTPGNALGAYLNGSRIEVFGNGQDATGDTMNDGRIIIHGNCGDTTGYGMRGGKILIEGNAGYRVGIHIDRKSTRLNSSHRL